MKAKIFVILSLCLVAMTAPAFSQKRDPEMAKMVRDVSPQRIESTIRKLVSFGTRNTLSEQNDPNRGIGAARDWIYSEFQKIGAECGECLTVRKADISAAKGGARSRTCESYKCRCYA